MSLPILKKALNYFEGFFFILIFQGDEGGFINFVKLILMAFLISVFLSFFPVSTVSAKANFIFSDTLITVTEAKGDTIILRGYKNLFPHPVTGTISYIDTSLLYFHRYNPVERNLNVHLGNIGQANIPLIFYLNRINGFNYDRDRFRLYQLRSEDFVYYNTRIPYTEAVAVLGSKQEQVFKIEHTQNITENLNFGFLFSRIKSEGFYSSQNTNISNAGFHLNYLSKNKKYGLLANVFYNKLRIQENGGVNPDEFLNVEMDDPRFYAVNLSDAETARNNRGINIKQYFNFTNKIYENDSIIDVIAKDGLSHEFSLFSENRAFKNQFFSDAIFFPDFFIDSLQTNDTSYFRIIENKFLWNRYVGNFIYNIGYRNQSVITKNLLRDSLLSNNFVEWAVSKGGKGGFFWGIEGNYLFSGNQHGDYRAEGNVKYFFPESSLNLTYAINNYSPEYIYTSFFSNHFIWHQQFNKTNVQGLKLNYENDKHFFNTGISYNKINQLVYLDENIRPFQHDGVVDVANLWLRKKLKYRSINFDNEVNYQKVIGEDIIRVPEILLRSSLFFDFPLFKKAIFINTGIEGLYFTNYRGEAYMPALGQFYLQENQSVGNYPIVNVFLNARIKQVRIFVQASHINAGLTGKNYLLVPGYPLYERSLRFGVSWIFFN
jgi:hypothetical protein